MHRLTGWTVAAVLLGAGIAGAALAEVKRAARTAQVSITPRDCARMVEHVASMDVNYQPGKDAYGRKVVSADLPGNVNIKLPKIIRIDLDLDLQTMLGIVPPPGVALDADLGTIEFRNGRAYYNGQPLFDPVQAKLAEQCKKMMAGG